jgi:hypothetical protein
MQVPETWADAERALGDIDGLLTAHQWDRAAIVYAFTHEGKAGNPNLTKTRQIGTITEFANRGLKGLSTRDTVRAYRKAWKIAIEKVGAPNLSPGDRYTAPDLPFPPWSTIDTGTYGSVTDSEEIRMQAEADGTGVGKALDVAKNLKAMEAAIIASPKVARAAEQALTRRLDQTDPKVREVKATTAETVWGVVADLQRLQRATNLLVEHLQQDADNLSPDVKEMCLSYVKKSRAALDFVESFITEGSITESSLQEFLAQE